MPPCAVILRMKGLGCEGCIFFRESQDEPEGVLSGEIPCFECETHYMHTGIRIRKTTLEPQPYVAREFFSFVPSLPVHIL